MLFDNLHQNSPGSSINCCPPVAYAPVVSVEEDGSVQQQTSFLNNRNLEAGLKDGTTTTTTTTSAGTEHVFVTPVYPEELLARGRCETLQELSPEVNPAIPYLFDVPNFTTLSGTIIALHMIALCISLFVCLARADFNFVLYLLGYQVWCLESRRHPYTVSVQSSRYPRTNELYISTKKMMESVQFYTFLLAGVVFVDFSWLMVGTASWLDCDSSQCGNSSATDILLNDSYTSQRLFQMTYRIHQFAIYASSLNLFIKILLVFLSITWLVQQKRHHKSLQLFGSSGGSI